MKTFLLIIWIGGYSPHVDSVEFDTIATCEAAAKIVYDKITTEEYDKWFKVVCVPR